MTGAPFAVMHLSGSDATEFRELRLDGLRRHPEAFGASYEEEVRQTLDDSRRRLESGIVFGARRKGLPALDGIAGLFIPEGIKTRHKGVLWGMYVRPEARGLGLGSALVARVIEHAGGVVEELTLAVGTSNDQAVSLYRRAGFEEYGLEERALKVADRYYDEFLMRLMLVS